MTPGAVVAGVCSESGPAFVRALACRPVAAGVSSQSCPAPVSASVPRVLYAEGASHLPAKGSPGRSPRGWVRRTCPPRDRLGDPQGGGFAAPARQGIAGAARRLGLARRLGPALGLALLALSLLPSSASAQASARGFAEVRFSGQVGVDGPFWTLVERVRPTLEAELGPRVRVVATVEGALSQGRRTQLVFQDLIDESELAPLLEQFNCAWPAPPDNEALWIDDIRDVLSVERLYVDVYLPFMDIRVGRQTVNWGSALFTNPTDPFPEVLLAEPWRPRQGVNAVRVTVPFGDFNDFNAVLATSDRFDAFRAAGKLRFNAGGTDFAIAGSYRSDGGRHGNGDGLVGLDLRGTFGVGWWVEAAMHLGDKQVYEELAVGLDYSFPVLQNLMIAAQYYRNGNGEPDPDKPTSAGGLTARGAIEPPTCDLPDEAPTTGDGFSALLSGADTTSDRFAPALGRQDYLLLSANLGIVQEVSVSLAALQNLNDGTGFFLPMVSVRPLGWLDVSASAQIPYKLWGHGGEFKPDPDDLLIEADLGIFGTRTADLSGLLPDATITIWTRASF